MSTVNINGKDYDVEQLKTDWALALMSRGIIVKLSFSRWRGTTKLTPETLGLKFTDESSYRFTQQYLDLGQQKLLPPEILTSIIGVERRARQLLNDYSFHTVWGRFIPFQSFENWEKQNEVIKNEYMNMGRLLGNQYDQIVLSVKGDYKNLAKDVWARLYRNDSVPTAAFIESFASNVVSKIPSREDIVNSFKYDSTYSIIPMPSFVENNIAEAQRIKTQVDNEIFNNELEKQTRQRIADEYLARKKELIDGFLECTVVSMRKEISSLCDDVLKSIGRHNHSIDNKSTNKLKNMIKKVKILNFYDDNEISALINSLETEIDRNKGEKDLNMIESKLKEIVEAGKSEFVPRNFNPSISVLEV